jgi:SAM-dependent methyltransferase
MNKIDNLLKNKNYQQKHGRLIFAKPYDDLKGELPKNPSAIRERLKPKLFDYSYIVTLNARKMFDRMLKLVPKRTGPLRILDLGCGYKPFQSLLPNDQYLGVDMSLNSFADVIADNHNLPFKDSIFDIIIVSEVLEHCENEYQVIKELRRVAKNQALVYLTLPFIFPLHGVPYDFNRFTRHKLKSLFKQDEIVTLKESNNIFASLFIFFNMILRILVGATKILYPVYIINNLLSLAVENLSQIYRHSKGVIAEYWEYALSSFPVGYSMIVKIKK